MLRLEQLIDVLKLRNYGRVMINEDSALLEAIRQAVRSPCEKSKRGVVIFSRGPEGTNAGFHARGFNAQPKPMACDGSDECRADCSKLCVHAEEAALIDLRKTSMQDLSKLEMIHVKVIDGKPVPSGPPSCWQCSRAILQAGIRKMWLMHEDGLKSYSAEEFHTLTLQNCNLPIIKEE